MTINCPNCRKKADLIVEVFAEDPRFNLPENDWKVTCGHCGFDLEGRFSSLHRALLLFFFLLPIAGFWALFLRYGEHISGAWLRFFLFLIHLALGLSAGTWLSTKYGARIIFASSQYTS